MGVGLVTEVLDYAPANLTPVDRLLLIVIAENANDGTRQGWPGWDLIARRMRWTDHKDGGKNAVSTALARLAERGVEVRVPIAKTKDGKPVYAAHGRRTTYCIPHFDDQDSARRVDNVATHPQGEGWTGQPPIEAQRVDETATQPEGGRVDNSATHSDAKGGTPEVEGWTTVPPLPLISPQEDKDTGVDDPLFSVPEVEQPAPKQKRTRKPEVDASGFAEWYAAYPRKEDRAKAEQAYRKALLLTDAATLLAAVKRFAPTTRDTQRRFIKHPTTWLNAQAWLDYAEDVPVVDETASEQTRLLLEKLRREEPVCEHGTPAGRTPHPTNGALLCVMCRNGQPAADLPPDGTAPAVAEVVTAYRKAATDAGLFVSSQLIVNVTGQTAQLLAGGCRLRFLMAAAQSAGAQGHDLTTQVLTVKGAAA